MSLCAVRSHRLIHPSTNQGSDQMTPLAAALPSYTVTHSVCAGFLFRLLRSPSRSLLLQFHPRMVLSHLPTCLMYSTGCPSSSGSCSVLVPWSGGVSWVLLRPTSEIFAIPPRAPEDAVHSDHPNRVILFLLLVHPQPRPVHSRWLVPLCGMGFRCRKDCSPGFFLTHSTLVSKLFFLAVQGSGALLSSNLEGALYKSP